MGNNPSLSTQSLVCEIDKDYERIKEDSKGIVIVHRQTQESFLLKEYTFGNENEFKHKEKDMRSQIDKGLRQYVISPIKMESKALSSFCSTCYKIYVIFEYTQVTLKDQIIARRKQAKNFQQTELWSILQSCSNALSELRPIISLNPNEIFINPEGHLKTIHDDLVDQNYRAILSDTIYYAPQKIRNFNKLDNELSLKKQSIFSMGLTLLEAAQLEDVSACYDYNQGVFNEQIMIEMLDNLSNKYSEGFIEVLSNILEPNPNRRSSLMEVQKSLETFWVSEDVSSMEQCTQDNVIQEEQEGRESAASKTNALRERQANQENPQQKEVKKYESSGSKQDTLIPQNIESFKIQRPYMPQALDLNPKTPKNPITLSQNHLYTDPKLLMMIKQDLQDINKLKHSAFYQTSKYTFMYPNTQSILNSIRNLQKQTDTDRKIEQFNNNKYQSIKEVEERQSFAKTIQERKFSRPRHMQHQELVYTIQTYQNGRKFQGTTLNGKKHGKGKLTFEDGAYYQGQFRQDKMDGKGVLYYQPNCPAYDGQWYNDQFHGYGILYNQKAQQLEEGYNFQDLNQVQDFWARYQGQFIQDNKQGKGKLILTNGQVFEGMFSQDIINGHGSFTTITGDKVQGIWQSNVLVEVLSQQ